MILLIDNYDSFTPESVSVLLRTGGGSTGQAQRCVDAGGDSGAGAGENRDLAEAPARRMRRGFPSRLSATMPEKRRCWASVSGIRRSPEAFGATIVRAARGDAWQNLAYRA